MGNNRESFFSCNGMTEFDNKIWFSARETNGICCLESDGSKLDYLDMFPKEREDGTYLYGECAVWKDKLIFAPVLAEELAVYDIKNKNVRKFFLNKEMYVNGYYTLAIWNDEIILLPGNNKNKVIVRINLSKETVQYINDWQGKFRIDDEVEGLFYEYCIDENILYAPVISSEGQIMKYDLVKNEISCIQMDLEGTYRAICCDGQNFYLCNQLGNRLIIVNKDFEKIDSRVLCEHESVRIKEAVFLNGHVFLFTMNKYDSEVNDMIIEYDANEKIVHLLVNIDASEGRKNYAHLDRRFATCCSKDGVLYALCGGNGVLYKIDSRDLRVSEDLIQRIDMLSIAKEKYRHTAGNITFIEKEDGNELLDFLLRQNVSREEKQEKNYGKIIWENIKS